MAYDHTAMLPSGERMSPAHPEGAVFYDNGQVAYIMRHQDGAFRVFTSFGSLDPDWAIGTRHEVHHDQTGRYMGSFEVVGWRVFATGEQDGEVPSKKLAHWVFK